MPTNNEINNKNSKISKFSIKKLKEKINILKIYIKTGFNIFFSTI